MAFEATKREWCELLTFFRLLADGKVALGTADVKKGDVYCKDAEIGYFLLTDKWSNGIMTKAVNEICSIAFDKLDIIRITGLVYKPNMASRRVLEKNDFVLEGIMRDAVFKNGNIYDMCIYAKYI